MFKFALINDQAKAPEQAPESVGYDVFAFGAHVVNPGQTKIIPLGFHAAIAAGYGAFVWDRSSFGAKGIHVFRQLIENPDYLHETYCVPTLGGCLDWSYRGQWGIILHNMTDKIYQIAHQAKVAQFVIQKCEQFVPEKVTMEELLAIPSLRGQGGLGSTDGQNSHASAQAMISAAGNLREKVTEMAPGREPDTGPHGERPSPAEAMKVKKP